MYVSRFGMYHDIMNIAVGHGIFGAQLIVKRHIFLLLIGMIV